MAKRKRDVPVLFWVSAEELELIHQKMQQYGTENLSAYLRKMALDGYVVKLELPELKELVSLMRRSSNNLNQLTRKVHETGRQKLLLCAHLSQNLHTGFPAQEKIIILIFIINCQKGFHIDFPVHRPEKPPEGGGDII